MKLLALLCLALLAAPAPGKARATRAAAASSAAESTRRDASQAAADQLIGGALAGDGAYTRLADLTDTVGPRLTGSPGAAAALQWALKRFQQDGLKVHLEKVMVPHWIRGEARAQVIASPTAAPLGLALTALGGSVATPPGGLTAEVIEVSSFEALHALGDRARGKIVLFQHTMSTSDGYGEFTHLRHHGAVEASRAGAVASLVRSLATASMRSPHTGTMEYESDTAKIPAAALATEDAELLHRLLQRGPVKVHLELGCSTLPDVESANVVAEVRGSEHPEEVVLLGAHLDSWDLAQGAIDDGAGVAIVSEAARLIRHLPRAPRRTVRVVLFMNEESGLDGALAYARAHAHELVRHVAALEADSGAGRPLALQLRAGKGGAEQLMSALAPLAALGVTRLTEGGEGGADIGPLGEQGVPIVSLRQDVSRYFDWHHSAADTLDKVSPHDLAETTAAVAWLAWSLAELPRDLPRSPAVAPRNEAVAPAVAPAAPAPAQPR